MGRALCHSQFNSIRGGVTSATQPGPTQPDPPHTLKKTFSKPRKLIYSTLEAVPPNVPGKVYKIDQSYHALPSPA